MSVAIVSESACLFVAQSDCNRSLGSIASGKCLLVALAAFVFIVSKLSGAPNSCAQRVRQRDLVPPLLSVVTEVREPCRILTLLWPYS